MNIYLMQEDGENFCVKAETLSGAVEIEEKRYIEEIKNEPAFNLKREVEYFHNEILQSCSLIGKLINP